MRYCPALKKKSLNIDTLYTFLHFSVCKIDVEISKDKAINLIDKTGTYYFETVGLSS